MEGQGVSSDFILFFFIVILLCVTVHLVIIFVVFPSLQPSLNSTDWQAYQAFINNTTLT
jgi:hypothetical protein